MFFEGKFGNKEVALLNWLKLCGCASFQEFSDKKRFAHLECQKQWPTSFSDKKAVVVMAFCLLSDDFKIKHVQFRLQKREFMAFCVM